ncbi:MAG: Glutamate-1-semialdehyde 2,1-aminomutase [Nitrospira sp.]|nr:Glutamate-1-semialdehyde 2,1-aminomutase [Nitrospira sp.]
MNYQSRLNRVIPGGAHTYSRGFDQFPSNAPQILARGEGAYVWDPEGNRYLDYGMALRAVTLGYANPRVNAGACQQIEFGNNLTRASVVELQAAELLVDLIPAVEMVKFAKNGSNVTTAAVKLARAFTGRPYVCVPRQQPFFSFDDWFIGTTAMDRGIPAAACSSTLLFDYGDIESMKTLLAAHPGQVAAVMMEPATTLTPCSSTCTVRLSEASPCLTCSNQDENFLHEVQKVCRDHGSLFILDEMITGFRWHLQGAAVYFGVEPDLTTFGKGMANGFSVAAVGGRRDVMEVGAIEKPGAERTFLLSSTHGGEMSSLAAFIETVAVYREAGVVGHMWKFGRRLREGLLDVARSCGASQYFSIEGPDICMNYVLRSGDGEVSLPLRTLFSQEMIRFGVLMPWISVSLAHDESELKQTLQAAEGAMAVVRLAAESDVSRYLVGDAIRPVFRKHN